MPFRKGRPAKTGRQAHPQRDIMSEHAYSARLTWTGAAEGPAKDYRTYSRAFTVEIAGKPSIVGSADPAYLGDPKVHNPEDLLLAALTSCHMLTYLALAARAKIPVIAYQDDAQGTMTTERGGGQFTDVLLRPTVIVAQGSDLAKAEALHDDAHAMCFVSRSVNFPVRHAAKFIEQAI